MTEKDIGKGNLLITYLFAGNEDCFDVLCNSMSENTMKKELQELAEQWKKRGLIKRYMIADDEIISEDFKKRVTFD